MAGSPSSSAAASLPGECTIAASAVSGLVDQAGGRFGASRVVLLAVTSLSGMPSAGELNGDDVIVITSYLPTAGAASAAQVNLLNAGAARAAVLGPEITAAQVDQLVSEGLSQRAVTEDLSGRALFANDSSALLPTAISVLAPLVAELRPAGRQRRRQRLRFGSWECPAQPGAFAGQGRCGRCLPRGEGCTEAIPARRRARCHRLGRAGFFRR